MNWMEQLIEIEVFVERGGRICKTKTLLEILNREGHIRNSIIPEKEVLIPSKILPKTGTHPQLLKLVRLKV